MITEDYVSFKVAKLLKEKGFLKGVDLRMTQNLSFYDNIGLTHNLNKYYDSLIQDKIDFVVAPTLQMTMKWLRYVHNLCIEPYRTACGYLYTISTIPYGSCKCNPKEGGDDEDSGQWTTYEGSCEAAIKYCLENLI